MPYKRSNYHALKTKLLKTKKILKIGLISLLVIFIAFMVFWKFFLPGIIQAKLEEKLTETFGSYYTVKFDEIQTDVGFSGFSLTINNPVFASDTNQKINNAKFPTVFFKAKALSLNNISIWSLLFNDQLEAEALTLKQANLTYLDNESPTNEEKNAQNKKAKNSPLSLLKVKKIKILNGEVGIAKFSDPKHAFFITEDIDIEIDNFKAKPEKLKRGDHMVNSFQNVKVHSGTSRFHLKGENYFYQLAHLELNVSEGSMDLNKVELRPIKEMKKLGKEPKYRETVAEINLQHVALSHVNFRHLVQYRKFKGGKVSLDNGSVRLLRNHKKDLDHRFVAPNLPEYIEMIRFPFEVDSLLFSNIDFGLDIITHKQEAYSHLKITELSGSMAPVYNQNIRQDTLNLSCEGYLMEKGKLNLTVKFPSNNPDESIYRGHIGTMPLICWNKVLSQFAPIKFDQGQVHGMSFWGHGNNNMVTGKFRMSYSDMKVNVLGEQNKKRKLFSFLGNTLIHNDRLGEKVETFDFKFEKEACQGQVVLWLGGVLDGIKTTVLGEQKARLVSNN